MQGQGGGEGAGRGPQTAHSVQSRWWKGKQGEAEGGAAARAPGQSQEGLGPCHCHKDANPLGSVCVGFFFLICVSFFGKN